MVVILRFRDLNIPYGETISRHARAIAEHGYTWWGWIRRQKEEFPGDLFAFLSTTCHTRGAVPIHLFDSGAEQVRRAYLTAISAAPGGPPLPTPEIRCTPSYMSEALLPAWFKLSGIEPNPLLQPEVKVEGLPTLADPAAPDYELLTSSFCDLSKLRHSGATLWTASVNEGNVKGLL